MTYIELADMLLFHKNYSICSETGLGVCEVLPCLEVREDGLYRNRRGLGIWAVGNSNGSTYTVCYKHSSNTLTIAQLVASAFIPGWNTNGRYYIGHRNGNRFDNRVSNLVLCDASSKYVISKRRSVGTYKTAHGTYRTQFRTLSLGTYKTRKDAEFMYASAYTNWTRTL